MQLKIFFRILVVGMLLFIIPPSPSQLLAANKCGIHINTDYGRVSEVRKIAHEGGWVVYSSAVDLNTLEGMFGQGLNVVVRGHAWWAYRLPENDTDELDRYALSWVANLAIAQTQNQPIFFMPINEPNQAGENDALASDNVKNYLNSLNKYLNDFVSNKQLLSSGKVRLLSPMLNQTHPNYYSYLDELGGAGFYANYYFSGTSQNLYDRKGCAGWPFCDPEKVWNGAKYHEVVNIGPHYAIEAGVQENGVIYQDEELSQIVSQGLTGPWNNSNFKMFAIFSQDPEKQENWDIFSAPLTIGAYDAYCGSNPPETGSYSSSSKEDIIGAFPQYEWVECENGSLVTDKQFCVGAGGGSPNLVPKPFDPSRQINSRGQEAPSLSDPVWYIQDDSLQAPDALKKRTWAADFIFDSADGLGNLVIPWAREVSKFLAGPFIYQGNTAIRELYDSGDLTAFRPLTDLTPKEVQDKLRFAYFESCGLGKGDICSENLHCHGQIPGPLGAESVICEKCCLDPKCEKFTYPCGGDACGNPNGNPEASNECLLSNGKEMREVISTIPPLLDPKNQPKTPEERTALLAQQDVWDITTNPFGHTNAYWWAEIPLMANPHTQTDKAINMQSCYGKTTLNGTTISTPWVAALKNTSEFLNTMLSPSKISSALDQPIVGEGLGKGACQPGENGEEPFCCTGKEAMYVLYENTGPSFAYQTTINMKDTYQAGLAFRIGTPAPGEDPQPNPDSPYKNYRGYTVSVGPAGQWRLWKTQTVNHCRVDIGGQDCNCVSGKCQPDLATCDCRQKSTLYMLNDPMLLANGFLPGGYVNAGITTLQIQVENVDYNNSEAVKITSRFLGPNGDWYTALDGYIDQYFPFLDGGLALSFYHGGNDDFAITCFDHNTVPDLGASVIQKDSFFTSARQLVRQDLHSAVEKWKNAKKTVTEVIARPIQSVGRIWRENDSLPNYQKVEKVLLASKKIFQPKTNMFAENQQPWLELKLVDCGYDQSSNRFGPTLHLCDAGAPTMPGCDGDIWFQNNILGGWCSTCGGGNCYTIVPEWTGHPPAGSSMTYSAHTSKCQVPEVSISCSFNADGSCACSGQGVITPPPPPSCTDPCTPPELPEYKPDGSSDPIKSTSHTAYEFCSYELACTKKDGSSAWKIGPECKPDAGGKKHTADSITKPIWAVVKYPFLNEIYADLSDTTNGLFAKFFPALGEPSESELDSWDDAGESPITYCARSIPEMMRAMRAAHPNDPSIPGSEYDDGFPDNIKLKPYLDPKNPNAGSFTKDAVCYGGKTADLQAYPQYIGGVANAATWLACTLNPAGADCQSFLGGPDYDASREQSCRPWSYYCNYSFDQMWTITDPMMDSTGIIEYVKNPPAGGWPESNIDTVIGSPDSPYDFIARAKIAWENAIAKTPDGELKSELEEFYREIDSYQGKTWLDFVIAAAQIHGWNPRFVVTLWIEETGASAYGHWKSADGQEILVEDLGCGGIKKDLPANLTCLFTGFEDLKQQKDWEGLLYKYKSWDWYNQREFCYYEDTKIEETFPGRLCSIYQDLQ